MWHHLKLSIHKCLAVLQHSIAKHFHTTWSPGMGLTTDTWAQLFKGQITLSIRVFKKYIAPSPRYRFIPWIALSTLQTTGAWCTALQAYCKAAISPTLPQCKWRDDNLHLGMDNTSALTEQVRPRFDRAPLIRPHGKAKNWKKMYIKTKCGLWTKRQRSLILAKNAIN